jgi:hypothetical protein
MHFRRPPVASTVRLVEGAPLARLESGTRAAVEIVGYPDGQMRLVTSTIHGSSGNRHIVRSDFLMFVDADEAKDALDALVDRVARVSRRPSP